MGKNKFPPGFRFHPTDEELIMYYLKQKTSGKRISGNPIAEVDVYKFAPWDLPDMCCLKMGDLKWHFYSAIVKKYGKGDRVNRATVYGYWKTTRKDRAVKYNGEVVGMIKTLVFHQGKAPRGDRTDWVMHEYRLEGKNLGIVQASYMLYVVFKKDGMGPKNGAQYGAPFKEEEWSYDDDDDDETDWADTPEGPMVAASLEAPQYQEPNDNNIESMMLDVGPMVVDSVSASLEAPESESIMLDVFTKQGGQMICDFTDSFIEAPTVTVCDEDDILSMLEALAEVDNPTNWCL